MAFLAVCWDAGASIGCILSSKSLVSCTRRPQNSETSTEWSSHEEILPRVVIYEYKCMGLVVRFPHTRLATLALNDKNVSTSSISLHRCINYRKTGLFFCRGSNIICTLFNRCSLVSSISLSATKPPNPFIGFAPSDQPGPQGLVGSLYSPLCYTHFLLDSTPSIRLRIQHGI